MKKILSILTMDAVRMKEYSNEGIALNALNN